MKQFIPFLVIAVIVGGAMLFLGDSYEEESFEPFSTQERWSQYWDMTIFLEESSEDLPNLGVHLEFERDDVVIDAIEFFVNTDHGGFFYQDLEMDEFEETILYSELCDFCEELESDDVDGVLMMNWRQDGEIRSEFFHFRLPLDGN
ncbi:hypothetical protein QA612_02175 [Evansella sp. AB-P1]|uniref:hypothetical protein n=1 Tax=Evansella sp. AB-P1 TaxID=3037653 RepID=UPI00241FCA4F|nr:hypothetical protein [Evansella sp. AB-P1]MDG5786280.1 hypothetical protein [Evansella sp. AB-P1]